MSAVVIFNIISFLASLTALIILFTNWSRGLKRDIKLLITGLLLFALFHHLSNVLEWSGLTNFLDKYEDYLEILVPIWWGIIFYAFLQLIVTIDIKESEERYKSLFKNNHSVMLLIDPENADIVDANPAAISYYGWRQAELTAKKITEINILTEEQIFQEMEKAESEQRHYFIFQHRLSNGDIRDVEVYSGPIELRGQKLLYSIVHDITDRKQAEKELSESEEKYRTLVENANDAIFIIQDGMVKFANSKTEDLTGYSIEEFIKIPFENIINPADGDMVLEKRRKRLMDENFSPTQTFTLINKSGVKLWVQLNTAEINWEGEPAIINFLKDITNRKQLESQIQRAQRMESLGTLAGGIAHDFNNLLMGIQGRTSLILMDTDSSHSQFELLKGIEDNVKSAADLAKQLLGFAKGGKYEVKSTDLNELIKSQNRMFGRTKKEITIHEKYRNDLWTAEVDRGQIEQVILNLYVNAWQAMPGGGDLYIQTEHVILDENYIKPFEIESGKYVKISITDTGIGMDEATQQKIFDPFFTTKEMGRGTGLGLASAYGIIKNHGGHINVYSEKGEGTTFNIYLPVSEREIVEETELKKEIFQGTETVLLVDDESTALDVGKSMLERLGYNVLVADRGRSALGIYEKNRDKIDIVILDMIMPELAGGETYNKLKEINPDIKVLLSSGYSINGQAAEILERGCDGFIQKPFSIIDLSQKIRRILDND